MVLLALAYGENQPLALGCVVATIWEAISVAL